MHAKPSRPSGRTTPRPRRQQYRVHYRSTPDVETWPMRWTVYLHPVSWSAPIICMCSTRDLARKVCRLLNAAQKEQ